MKQGHQHSQFNLTELKAQMVKKLGQERFSQYFYCLNKFLSLKVTKVEFDKLCFRIVGREHIPLHNTLIRSILQNVCGKKGTPQNSHRADVLRHDTQVGLKEINPDGYQNGCHTIDVQLVSPRKSRTCYRDRRIGERRSALGHIGKTSVALQLSSAAHSCELNTIFENGVLNPTHNGSLVQQHQGIMQQIDNENDVACPMPSRISASPAHMKDHSRRAVREDGKQAHTSSPLQAPLGVSLCPVSIGSAHRGSLTPASSLRSVGATCNGALLDSHTLKEQIEQIVLVQGLDGVSVDCANLLNHGLDSYLKRLIMSCIELVGSRSGRELEKNNILKLQTLMKHSNGIKPGHRYQLKSTSNHVEVQGQKIDCRVSLQDFRVTMELNPRLLGENWPLLHEKISMQAFKE